MFILFLVLLTLFNFFTYIKIYKDDPTIELYFTLHPLNNVIYVYKDIASFSEYQYLLVQDENEFIFEHIYVFIKKTYPLIIFVSIIFGLIIIKQKK
jgi:hypothetical protein